MIGLCSVVGAKKNTSMVAPVAVRASYYTRDYESERNSGWTVAACCELERPAKDLRRH